jgi:membrane associated rhomboid family serine protease
MLRISTALAALTVITSLTVAHLTTGNPMGTVKVTLLRSYGGTAFDDLANFELWRLATAQLVHAKQAHMLLNAALLLLLGNLVEARTGGLRAFSVWLLAGGIGTAISPVLIEAPWNIGTGASQATFAFAGCAAVLALSGTIRGKSAWALISLTLLTGFGLDMIYAGYPKPGHVTGFLLGACIGAVHRPARNRQEGSWTDKG